MFGLTNSEGNHGEDVKEYYYYLDSTPTQCLPESPSSTIGCNGPVSDPTPAVQPARSEPLNLRLGSLKSRHHLSAQQTHCRHDLGVRDQSAGIQLGQDAVEAEFVLQVAQALDDQCRRADQHLTLQCLVIG